MQGTLWFFRAYLVTLGFLVSFVIIPIKTEKLKQTQPHLYLSYVMISSSQPQNRARIIEDTFKLAGQCFIELAACNSTFPTHFQSQIQGTIHYFSFSSLRSPLS